MPELPEVETVKNSLKELILNQKILSLQINYERIIKNVSIDNFINSLTGQTIIDINRYGKYLIFILDDYYLISHLRMEGKYLIKTSNEITKHEYIIFQFSDFQMTYHDTRKFGTMHLYQKSVDIYQELPLKNVGYEPFDNRFTVEYLHQKFQKIKRPIKKVLLDQKIIAGIGNIYADEILFKSGLNPLQPTNTLTKADVELIINSTKEVLKKAIALGGTTIRSFVSSHDISGRFQNELLIHTKKKCYNCGKEVRKIYVGGRGTYHCENCQPLR